MHFTNEPKCTHKEKIVVLDSDDDDDYCYENEGDSYKNDSDGDKYDENNNSENRVGSSSRISKHISVDDELEEAHSVSMVAGSPRTIQNILLVITGNGRMSLRG